MPEIGVVEKYPSRNKQLAVVGSLVKLFQGKVPVRIYNNHHKTINIKNGKPIALCIAVIKEDKLDNTIHTTEPTGELKTLFQDL